MLCKFRKKTIRMFIWHVPEDVPFKRTSKARYFQWVKGNDELRTCYAGEKMKTSGWPVYGSTRESLKRSKVWRNGHQYLKKEMVTIQLKDIQKGKKKRGNSKRQKVA